MRCTSSTPRPWPSSRPPCAASPVRPTPPSSAPGTASTRGSWRSWPGTRAVELASPVLEVEAALVEPERLRGRTLTIQGIDLFRAARLTPHLIGEPLGEGDADTRFALLDDGLYLSPAALEALGLGPGDRVGIQVGGRVQRLTIAGRLPAARAGDLLGTMDIGFAQWRLDHLGRLSRIDLQLTPGSDPRPRRRRLGSARRGGAPERRRGRQPGLQPLPCLSGEPERAGPGGPLHRGLPGLLAAVPVGGRAPHPARLPAGDRHHPVRGGAAARDRGGGLRGPGFPARHPARARRGGGGAPPAGGRPRQRLLSGGEAGPGLRSW